MRLPRCQITTRRLMVVVAIAALAAYGVVLKRRRDEYASRALSCAYFAALDQMKEQTCLHAAASSRRFARTLREKADRPSIRLLREKADRPSVVPSERRLPLPRGGSAIGDNRREQAEAMETSVTEFEEAARRHARRAAAFLLGKTKYERAARYPWLPVAPDPPELEVPSYSTVTARPIPSR